MMPNWIVFWSNSKTKVISKYILHIIICLASFQLSGQNSDSLSYEDSRKEPLDSSQLHSVSRATWLSTLLPGAGQAYNGKYWKMPIVYGGIGACAYFAIDNHRLYRQYLDAFLMRADSSGVDQYQGIYSDRQLVELQNIYRDWRDLSLIIGAAIWALNVVDAHVDAHLFYYNVNEDLSFNLEPRIIPMGNFSAVGIGLKINLDPWK